MLTPYSEKENCCGCHACYNVCRVDAITFKDDEYGFAYPFIDETKCIGCNMCREICDFQNGSIAKTKPIEAYAAVNKDEDVLKISSSGGVFGAFAKYFLDQGGVVFGCAYNENMEPVHISAENDKDLKKIHGSKYVQSNTYNIYAKIKEYLAQHRKVLFTGTPCQVAALKSYLGVDYNNLLTVDFVCHGVPSASMFKKYISYLEKKHEMKITDYCFRSKARGWPAYVQEIKCTKQHNVSAMNIKLGAEEEFYLPYYLKGNLSRPSCFECRYASPERVSDITIGDFWGYQQASLKIKISQGLSICLLNNSMYSKFQGLFAGLNLERVEVDLAVRGNRQLNAPECKGDRWDQVMENFKKGNFDDIAKEYLKSNKKQVIKSKIVKHLPHYISMLYRMIIKKNRIGRI